MDPSTASWRTLVPEVQAMILKEMSQSEGCAHAAAVCREWQEVLEPVNFSRITLTVRRLTKFRNVTRRWRHLVKYIWLRIDLQEYDCPDCKSSPEPIWMERNMDIIRSAIHDALEILSTWEAAGELCLDISVHSPSDSRHYFKDVHFGPDVVPASGSLLNSSDFHDPTHGWLNSRRTFPRRSILRQCLERLGGFNITPDLDFFQQLPPVGAITSLLLRRQTRYSWGTELVEELVKHLPRLQAIHLEPWKELESRTQEWQDFDVQRLFKQVLPSQLKKIILFEDFNEYYQHAIGESDGYVDTRTPSVGISRALANTSLNLEKLSAAFMIDARHFFEARMSDWAWRNLTGIALTSLVLVPDGGAQTRSLLREAAAAALGMPILRCMEIWNGGRGIACVFRFQVSEDHEPRSATITWRGNWECPLDCPTIQYWQKTANERCRELRVVKELLDGDAVIRSHGDAIHRLQLVNEVARPVSLWQIGRETSQ
ncbi:hypothetical protein TARUN_3580 [Trichoderma arundinaceum]|uniref:DUF6546 domain-containing protein n=1 Tax=Trichoderma arundinaceum TaxID=490622 RepID=A0A395NR90_TRIAR|nr:hypothetical protein TARUN_3580 [Trichoderma arundinaceum]